MCGWMEIELNELFNEGGLVNSDEVEMSIVETTLRLSAKELAITWGNNPQYWQWTSIPESRFEKVPELLDACTFEIRGWMNTRILSPKSHYSAFVVYKTRNVCYGFCDLPIHVGIGLVGQKPPNKRVICFDESTDKIKKWARRELMKSNNREDGWIEAEIGEFFNEGDCDAIELSIVDITSPYWKRGLIIQGIEFPGYVFVISHAYISCLRSCCFY